MKTTGVAVIVVVLIITGAIIVVRGDGAVSGDGGGNNVNVVGGRQIVEISAKGGYRPRRSLAKAGLPTAGLLRGSCAMGMYRFEIEFGA